MSESLLELTSQKRRSSHQMGSPTIPVPALHAWVITGVDISVGSSRDGSSTMTRSPRRTDSRTRTVDLHPCFSPSQTLLPLVLSLAPTIDTPSRDGNRPYQVSVDTDFESTSCGHHTPGVTCTIGRRRTRTLAAPPKYQHHNPADCPSGMANGSDQSLVS